MDLFVSIALLPFFLSGLAILFIIAVFVVGWGIVILPYFLAIAVILVVLGFVFYGAYLLTDGDVALAVLSAGIRVALLGKVMDMWKLGFKKALQKFFWEDLGFEKVMKGKPKWLESSTTKKNK